MISFEPLKSLMAQQGISLYRLKSDKIIGSATLDNIRLSRRAITTDTINAICEYLNCQPGDIMEYVPDDQDQLSD